MKQLSKIQKDFIIDKFFGDYDFPGAKNIGEKLLTDGYCIVAGTTRLINGGIGNFIDTQDAPELIGCMKYSLEIDKFLVSQFFREYVGQYSNELMKQHSDIEEKLRQIEDLL